MNSKEALNILWDELELYCSKHNIMIHYWNLLEIIKEDLDILEIMEIKNKDLEHELDREEILVDKIIKERDKYKNAIDVLKDKTIMILALKLSKNLNDYNRMASFDKLTQREYEILKEVLECN